MKDRTFVMVLFRFLSMNYRTAYIHGLYPNAMQQAKLVWSFVSGDATTEFNIGVPHVMLTYCDYDSVHTDYRTMLSINESRSTRLTT